MTPTMSETTNAADEPEAPTPKDGISGFSERVLRYFLTFLQTDFKRQQAPRRRIQIKSENGFRTGIPLRKYPSLYKAMWKQAQFPASENFEFRLPPQKYTAPISATLKDLIRQHVQAIKPDAVSAIVRQAMAFAVERRAKAIANPEKFVDSVQIHFVELTGEALIQPLLAMLDGPFREQAYSAIESIYDVESDLTTAITCQALEALPSAVNTLIVSGDQKALDGVFTEFFDIESVKTRIQTFFDDFATADAFVEVRDLQHALRSAEQQSFYVYFCEIRFGAQAFPLFYIPGTIEFDDQDRAYAVSLDPHLFVNKQAVDWILQEMKGETATLPISPILERIVYVGPSRSFVDEMESVINRLIPAFDLAAGLNLRDPRLQQESSTTVKIANSAYFAIFDKSDEALLNDYEELLSAFEAEQGGARIMFENIIRGFLKTDPVSVRDAIDRDWEAMSPEDRLVAEAPIPVNEEQRKIQAALRNNDCLYIAVQGPPGTGKSHTITAIAFDCILNGQNVLILSDKSEALDVVQDKLESAIQRVRHGDADFPNPILRLGKGNSYNRLITASAREKIKTHHNAARAHASRMDSETVASQASLKEDIAKTISVFSQVKLSEMDALHKAEKKLNGVEPGITLALQSISDGSIDPLLKSTEPFLNTVLPVELMALLQAEHDSGSADELLAWLEVYVIASKLSPRLSSTAMSLFYELEPRHHDEINRLLTALRALKNPLFGYLFKGSALSELNDQLRATAPCIPTTEIRSHANDIKQALHALNEITAALGGESASASAVKFAYRMIRTNQTTHAAAARNLMTLIRAFISTAGPVRLDYGVGKRFFDIQALLAFVLDCGFHRTEWNRISLSMNQLPTTDYVGTKTHLEQLHTARMTRTIDQRFIDFVQDKSATAKDLGGVIKSKQKFPENEFHHLSTAFPCIVAGIREYAEYVPLKQQLFDVVVIDEASQVSVAQALPALLRAKKVVVFGDQKQFSNVKSANASNAINAGHLSELEAYFRANVSDAATKLERLKHFNVKKSILEFFDLIANYQTMLRKHFRGYQELISFSSKTFYDGQLQAIKIRSKRVSEIIRFEVLAESSTTGKGKNTNRSEADFILAELRRIVDVSEEITVGILTPFREQQKLLTELLFRDEYSEIFEKELRLKIMTFDTCQGEERDLIIYSMVANETHDGLNYIFPVSLEQSEDQIEQALKVQRLNVGFSRAKEGLLFVLSKPVESFRGSIGKVLRHYKNLVDSPDLPTADDVDPASPMEAKVLDWIYKSAFYQQSSDLIEIVPQFPIGEYLKQLDPYYQHPAYRCDFLLRYYVNEAALNIVIEYDGFAEHFVNRGQIHVGNWDHYYRPEDIERQYVLESYGYKFLRLNRFNLGQDPIESLSTRLSALCKNFLEEVGDAPAVSLIKDDVGSLEDGTKKRCDKCGMIRLQKDFYDRTLRKGVGGYGRHCVMCKPSSRRLRSQRYG